MYWSIGMSLRRSAIEALLDRTDATIDELLFENEVLEEVRASNSRLLDVLCEAQNINKMIYYVFGADPSDPNSEPSVNAAGEPFMSPNHKLQYARASLEILSSENWAISGAIIDTPGALDELWKVMYQPKPHSVEMMNSFTRIMTSLLMRKRVEMLIHFKQNPKLLEQFLVHMYSQTVIDFMVKIIMAEDAPSPPGFTTDFESEPGKAHYKLGSGLLTYDPTKLHILDWMSYYGLMRGLVNKMDPLIYSDQHRARIEEKLQKLKDSKSAELKKDGNSDSNGDGNGDGNSDGDIANTSEEHDEIVREVVESAIESNIDQISLTAQVILDIITMTQNSLPDPSNGHCALVHELCTGHYVEKIMNYMLQRGTEDDLISRISIEPLSSAVLINGVYIFIELIRRNYTEQENAFLTGGIDNNSNNSNESQHQFANSRLFKTMLKLTPMMKCMVSHMDEILSLLEKPRSVFAITLGGRTSSLVRQSMDAVPGLAPLGFERLRVCELFAELIHCSNMMILNMPRDVPADSADIERDSMPIGQLTKWEIMRRNTISHMFDLFVAYPWNNFLHAVVYDILHQTLALDTDVEVNRRLLVSLFRDTHVTERIVDAIRRSDEYAQSNKGARLGYMGHLILMSEEVAVTIEAISRLIDEELRDVIIFPQLVVDDNGPTLPKYSDTEYEALSSAEKAGFEWMKFVLETLNPTRAHNMQHGNNDTISVLGDLAGPLMSNNDSININLDNTALDSSNGRLAISAIAAAVTGDIDAVDAINSGGGGGGGGGGNGSGGDGSELSTGGLDEEDSIHLKRRENDYEYFAKSKHGNQSDDSDNESDSLSNMDKLLKPMQELDIAEYSHQSSSSAALSHGLNDTISTLNTATTSALPGLPLRSFDRSTYSADYYDDEDDDISIGVSGKGGHGLNGPNSSANDGISSVSSWRQPSASGKGGYRSRPSVSKAAAVQSRKNRRSGRGIDILGDTHSIDSSNSDSNDSNSEESDGEQHQQSLDNIADKPTSPIFFAADGVSSSDDDADNEFGASFTAVSKVAALSSVNDIDDEVDDFGEFVTERTSATTTNESTPSDASPASASFEKIEKPADVLSISEDDEFADFQSA
ncbi:hypothetical protein GQ42DRAFT_165197 [Ramicandelaber brevisporus]|nr:hypothetical protein GQ42DRAFT_165197 [Ramicandelaber brevisporus]